MNIAMLDATDLALRLAESADLNDAVAGYEAQMFVCATEAAAGTHDGLAFVSEDGLAHLLAHFGSSDDDRRGAGINAGRVVRKTH